MINWPCFYLERHAKPESFGLSIAHDNLKDNCIIVGLQALRAFKYIVFDNINKEAEFSYNESFKPGKSDVWEKYPFDIREDSHGNAFLFVEVPVAGEKTELQLDTGNGKGLAVREDLWEKIQKTIRPIQLRSGKDLYPYIGRLSCKRGTISKLEMGQRTVGNAEISVFANDSPLLENCRGLLGMQYFEDTVMVLDFENKLMRLKNPQR
ncbi:MAG: aspartyl protease family protein [Sedimentisphaerales bacterium]|nr:aspartyl protease family protein [Sedimentisphaerales bacterium]